MTSGRAVVLGDICNWSNTTNEVLQLAGQLLLGRNVGNALEVVETVEYLKGEGTREPRLHEVTMALAGEMIALGGLRPSAAAGRARAEAALARRARGGDVRPHGRRRSAGRTTSSSTAARYLAHAPVIKPCTAERSGHVVGMNAREVGIAVVALGGGRSHADDAIDPSVGLTDVIDVGTQVRAGSPLCIVHAASDADADAGDRHGAPRDPHRRCRARRTGRSSSSGSSQ